MARGRRREINEVLALVDALVEAEAAVTQRAFLAPVVRGGRVRVRVEGVVLTLRPPRRFEGWGIFRAEGDRARLIEPAPADQVEAFLSRCPSMRCVLARGLRGGSWLAVPCNGAGAPRARPVHLVEGGAALDVVIARFDGSSWWFEAQDMGADPTLADLAREALRALSPLDRLTLSGLTPEHAHAYALALDHELREHALALRRGEARASARQRARLEAALAMGGGELIEHETREDHWLVRWRTREGVEHHSAISPDLTVMSAGICLSGLDRDFDLQSLVGVVEQGEPW